jgi:hypothetical protein
VPYISSRDLSKLFGLSPRVISRWPLASRPQEVMRGQHRYEDVNSWLAKPGRAHGFGKPPVIEDIIEGRITFMLSEHAAQLIGPALGFANPFAYTTRRIHRGSLEALRLRSTTWVVTEESVRRLIRSRLEAEDFTLVQVGKIFGINPNSTLYRLAQKGVFKIVQSPDNANRACVTRASVVALLRTLLEAADAPTTPQDWIEDRLDPGGELLQVPQVATMLGLIDQDVKSLLGRRLQYITSPEAKKYYITKESVRAYLSQQGSLSTAEKARVFNVTEQRMRAWMVVGRLSCPMHPRVKPEHMHRGCLVAFIEQNCQPRGTTAARWVRWALGPSGREMWGKHAVFQRRLLTADQLKEAAAAGRIPTILTPGGIDLCDAAAVKREARRVA